MIIYARYKRLQDQTADICLSFRKYSESYRAYYVDIKFKKAVRVVYWRLQRRKLVIRTRPFEGATRLEFGLMEPREWVRLILSGCWEE